MASQGASNEVVELEKEKRERAPVKSKSRPKHSAGSSSTAGSSTSQAGTEYEEIAEVQRKGPDASNSPAAATRPQQVPTGLTPRRGRDRVVRQVQQPSIATPGPDESESNAPGGVYTSMLEETLDSNMNHGGMLYQTPNTTLEPSKDKGKYEQQNTTCKKIPLLVASITAALLILLLLTTCVAVLFARVDSLKSELMAAQQSNLAQQVLVNDRLSQLNTTNTPQTDYALHQVLSLLNDTILDIVATYSLGRHPSNPVTSCATLLAASPSTPSGYYWVRAASGSALQVYCHMTRRCGNITGGWTRVAQLDMTQNSSQCPGDFREYDDTRVCGIRRTLGPIPNVCSIVLFNSTTTQYSKVCGRIRAYQFGYPEAFHSGYDINSFYVDGISLTHGSPRQHIWTFAAASNGSSNTCPCANTEQNISLQFVSDDYFCDTANSEPAVPQLYLTNLLWDGEGCSSDNACCSFNTPPWFYTQLPQPTTDHMEMRACSSQFRNNADIAIEFLEIYVQ